ncbi:MAG: pyridoxal-phosphate dependent enzyme [Parcubacteria group bacterium]|jgi:cysteine synthase
MKNVFKNHQERVGNTPIVKWGMYKDTEIFLKLEGANPTGSLKDRSALAIIRNKLETGELKKGMRLLDASSGSFACSMAYFGNRFGFKSVVVVNKKLTRINGMFLLGQEAEVIHYGEVTGDGYNRCLEMVRDSPDKYCFLDQLNNWVSPSAHFETTGPEILGAMPDVDFIAASMGSGATLYGVSTFMNKKKPEVKIIASNGKPGKKIAGTFVDGPDYVSPFIMALREERLVDFVGLVSYEEALGHVKADLIREGFNVGLQTGGVFEASIQAIDDLGLSGKLVIISGDHSWKNMDKFFPEMFS